MALNSDLPVSASGVVVFYITMPDFVQNMGLCACYTRPNILSTELYNQPVLTWTSYGWYLLVLCNST